MKFPEVPASAILPVVLLLLHQGLTFKVASGKLSLLLRIGRQITRRSRPRPVNP